MATQPHFFIAIDIPIEVKRELEDWRQEWQDIFPFKKWVHPIDYHLTLAFLGASSMEKLLNLRQILRGTMSNSNRFFLQLDALGVFGSMEKPRIFWVGVKDNNDLYTLRNEVYKNVQKAEFQLETRPFHPHITLARKWESHEDFSNQLLEDAKSIQHKKVIMEVASIQLFQTHIHKEPKYEVIDHFHF